MPRPERTQIRDLIAEQMYEDALDAGEINWMLPTRVDPGCYTADLDIEVEIEQVVDEDTQVEIPGEFIARAKGNLHGHLLYDREYELWTGQDGFVRILNYEDV